MAPTSRYRSPADLPSRVTVFPLRGVILLPRAELPLNVFEPRYLAMIEDAIAGNRLIGIIQPGNTGDASDGPAESPSGRDVGLKRIGCVGRITAFQELNDGRLGVTLTGIARFTIASEVAVDKPYRMMEVGYDRFIGDFAADDTAKAIDREALMRVLKIYLDRRHLEADWNAVARAPLEPLVNGMSAMSPFGPEEKQALLEAVTVQKRAEVLMALAEMAIAGGNSASGSGGTRLQ